MMRGLALTLAGLAAVAAHPDASVEACRVDVPDAGTASTVCDDLIERFYELVDGGRTCSRDSDCDCVGRIDVSGGGLLGVEVKTAGKLRKMAGEYSKKKCPISCRFSNAPVCRAHCDDHVCAP
jgi:hypothetical protein